MIRYSDKCSPLGVRTQQTVFATENGEKEVHLLLTVAQGTTKSAGEIVENILSVANQVGSEEGVTLVFCRFMVENAQVQKKVIEEEMAKRTQCALSIVGQAPADGTPLAVWAYLSTAEMCSMGGHLTMARHKEYAQYWATCLTHEGVCPHCQTLGIFEEYINRLKSAGLSMEAHCQRTWLFVDDIDKNYSRMVTGRNEVFDHEGLTLENHFIASTGIAGGSGQVGRVVMMDAVAYDLPRESVHYLYASTHMNRTSDYGVRFERGVKLSLPHASQVFISGTASIDDKGQVVNAGDVGLQAERMMENVETLLLEAHATSNDIQQAIVYLRNREDHERVEEFFARCYPKLPYVLVCAPVCRPNWLVEIECMAMVWRM